MCVRALLEFIEIIEKNIIIIVVSTRSSLSKPSPKRREADSVLVGLLRKELLYDVRVLGCSGACVSGFICYLLAILGCLQRLHLSRSLALENADLRVCIFTVGVGLPKYDIIIYTR